MSGPNDAYDPKQVAALTPETLAQAVEDAVIRLAAVLAASDFAATARTLDRMGLAGMDAAQIRRTFDRGFA